MGNGFPFFLITNLSDNMENFETVTTTHPLRTITLRYDRSTKAPEFETAILQCYHEIHDRVWERLQRAQRGRKPAPGYRYRIEQIERLYGLAAYRFNHLKRMLPTNPVRDTVYEKLKDLLTQLDDALNLLVPQLIEETNAFIVYEDYCIAQDEWLEQTALPQLHEIFEKHDMCSVDIVFFDLDLEGFRHELAFAKKQERLYLDEMNTLVENYSELNNNVEDLIIQAGEFDPALLE